MGDERGSADSHEVPTEAPTKAITAISARLVSSLRRSLRKAEASGAPRASLENDHDQNIFCLVYLTANSRCPSEKTALRSLRSLVNVAVESKYFGWADRIGPQVCLELAEGRPGTGIQTLYANLNHHNFGTRDYVIDIAWLARSRLDSSLAAERILFNVGASHGSARKGLAVLWAMCGDDNMFWQCIQNAQPDFANDAAYGWGLDTRWPERRAAVLANILDDLLDLASDLAHYVRNPSDLWDFECRAAETAKAATDEIASQLKLWP